MTLPYSNLSKFLKLFMLIHSILFIHSIAIEDYVLKNYGLDNIFKIFNFKTS